MAEAVSQKLRREIRKRAGERCEYCLIPEALLLVGCEVDHIVSRKHGGITELPNLALSCARCNRAKGHGHRFNPCRERRIRSVV